jgi:CBS domain containing-hemolysin-like protein
VSLFLALALLAGNAFFVAAQFALLTVRRDQVEPLAGAGRPAARVALAQIRNLSRMLAGSQLGIAACSLGLGAVAEPAIAGPLSDLLALLRLPVSLDHPLAWVLALLLISYAHMVIGEMVPKNLALVSPLTAALLLAMPMAAWVYATRPVLVVIGALADGLLRLGRVEPKSELDATYNSEELGALITESAEAGLLDSDERQRLDRVLALTGRRAADVAIPLADLVTVAPGATVAEVEALVAETGYSRFPVRASYSGAEVSLTGYLHAKDLLGLDPSRRELPVPADLVRPMVTIADNLPLHRAFSAMERAGRHIGMVVSGGHTIGLITLEDVLEELVGEIHDATHRRDQPG